MEKQRLLYLLQHYSSDTASTAELAELHNYVKGSGDGEVFTEMLADLLPQLKAKPLEWGAYAELAKKAVQIDKVIQSDNANQKDKTERSGKLIQIDQPAQVVPVLPSYRRQFLRKWGWAAASIILILCIGTYTLFTNKKKISYTDTPAIVEALEIQPGKDGAILTLADGSQVVLDSQGDGLVATQNGSQAVIENGELVYNVTGKTNGDEMFNTMTTPNGRQFNMYLPDGTRVWLNAASSIKYPTVFTGKERKVVTTGEVYFEVAKNTKRPFIVQVYDKAEVEVLGTHFNVNAYENETTINTTLIEGSIRVNALSPGSKDVDPSLIRDDKQLIAPRNRVILQPGQQAQITTSQTNQKESQELTVIENVATDRVLAWKEGFFNFEGLAFEQLMRQLERWYDIQVVYENGIPHKKLIGKMTKDVSLNGLLIGLKELGIHCRLEARKLIILP